MIELDPANRWAIASRADVLIGLGRLDEALEGFSAVLGLDPSDAWAWAGCGRVHEAQGRHEQALAARPPGGGPPR